MQCYVYRGRKENHFLFLPKPLNEDQRNDLPPALLNLLGELSLVIEFDLGAKDLAQADKAQVEADILAHGYYLQMPKKDMRLLEDQLFN